MNEFIQANFLYVSIGSAVVLALICLLLYFIFPRPFRTTIILIVLAAAGVGAWYWYQTQRSDAPPSESVVFLEKSLVPDKIQSIEVLRGKQSKVKLDRAGKEWTLPGKWPARVQESDEWVKLVTTLHSRFAPLPISKDAKDSELRPFGLDGEPLTLRISVGDESHTLRFG